MNCTLLLACKPNQRKLSLLKWGVLWIKFVRVTQQRKHSKKLPTIYLRTDRNYLPSKLVLHTVAVIFIHPWHIPWEIAVAIAKSATALLFCYDLLVMIRPVGGPVLTGQLIMLKSELRLNSLHCGREPSESLPKAKVRLRELIATCTKFECMSPSNKRLHLRSGARTAPFGWPWRWLWSSKCWHRSWTAPLSENYPPSVDGL